MEDSKEETKNNRFTKRIGATTYGVRVPCFNPDLDKITKET